jgi:AcrR family transcriptional regulator
MSGIARPRGAPLAAHIAETAAVLFYRHGINVVGVDRIADTAGVTKRTLYRHYHSKDVLIAASLMCGPRIPFPANGSGRERILAFFDGLIAFVSDPSYRGCPHINAAVELADRTHPARKIVEDHATRRRSWFYRRVCETAPGDAGVLAEQLDVLFDGALANATKRSVALPAIAARAAAETLLDQRHVFAATASASYQRT